MASVAKSPLSGAKTPLVKSFSIARTNTTAAVMLQLPAQAKILYFVCNGDTVSNAATTAVVSLGSTSSANEYGTVDVKTYGAVATVFGTGGLGAVSTATATPIGSNKPIYAKYAETGTASTAGGPWTIDVVYVA